MAHTSGNTEINPPNQQRHQGCGLEPSIHQRGKPLLRAVLPPVEYSGGGRDCVSGHRGRLITPPPPGYNATEQEVDNTEMDVDPPTTWTLCQSSGWRAQSQARLLPWLLRVDRTLPISLAEDSAPPCVMLGVAVGPAVVPGTVAHAMQACAWTSAGPCSFSLLLGPVAVTAKPRQACAGMRHGPAVPAGPGCPPPARHPRMAGRPSSVIVQAEKEEHRRLHRARGPGQGAGMAGSRPRKPGVLSAGGVPKHTHTSQGVSWPLPSHLTPAQEVVGFQKGANSALERP